MPNLNKHNFHKFLFGASAVALLLSGITTWLAPQSALIWLTVRWGLWPSALIMCLFGVRIWRTRSLHPKDAQKFANDKAIELLNNLSRSPVGSELNNTSKKVIRIASLIEDHNYPELHTYETALDELSQLVPACQLPRHYSETNTPLLDWHKYDLCIIAAEDDVDSAKQIKDALLAINDGWRIYLEALERDGIGEEQERFIKRVFYGSSLKCMVLLSYHMINHGRSKQELQFAMQRGQINAEEFGNYLIPIAMDKYGLDFMKADSYLYKYSEHLEIIENKSNRFEAIVKKLSRLLRQSKFYIPPSPRGPKRKAPAKRFSVALSFPGEHRQFVEKVAEELRLRLNDESVFYDRNYQAELARMDLDIYLQAIYSEHSELVVVFLCAEYEAKKWCGLEWRAIRELITPERGQTLMLIRFDKTDIPGITSNDGYVDAEYITPEEVADLIIRRLFQNRNPDHSAITSVSPPCNLFPGF